METVPDEVVGLIASNLPKHDITNLMRTCRRFDALLIHTLWARIEMHAEGHHLALDLQYPQCAILDGERPYFHRDDYEPGYQPEVFFQMLHRTALEDNNRLQLLCGRVRSLCTVVLPSWIEDSGNAPELSIWHIFANFINLESLEIYGHCYSVADDETLPKIGDAPLPQLRHVKLFGYIPRQFAAWLLGSRKTFQRLELGMLDRPISSNCAPLEDAFQPLRSENLLVEATDEEEDLYEGSDYGSLDGECVVPRPLSGFFTEEIMNLEIGEGGFPALKHLYLCQPSRCDYENSCRDYSWSTRAEKACLADWRRLLLMSSPTIEVLLLEQRPAAEEIESDTFGCFEYVDRAVRGAGVGSEALVEMITELVNMEELFPKLKKVYLYGIAVGTQDGESISKIARGTAPASELMWRLKERGISCEARLGVWSRFEKHDGITFWDRDFANGEDDSQRYTLLAIA